MLFVEHEHVGLTVKVPMILETDSEGTVDLCNNFSAGGRT